MTAAIGIQADVTDVLFLACDRSFIVILQASDDIEESCLAGAGITGDGIEGAFFKGKGSVVEDDSFSISVGTGETECIDLKDLFHKYLPPVHTIVSGNSPASW